MQEMSSEPDRHVYAGQIQNQRHHQTTKRETMIIHSIYNDLSYLIGMEVEIKSGIEADLEADLLRATVIADYPKAILLQLTFRNEAGLFSYNRMISKASMFTGDVQIRRLTDGTILTGSEVLLQGKMKGDF